MTRVRRCLAALTVLTLIGAPASALAGHSRCEVGHHACSGVTSDLCCCRLVRASDTPPATSAAQATNVVAVAPLAVDISWTASPHSAVHLARPRPACTVADRLALFKVLLI